MLKTNEIQALYEEVRPGQADKFMYEGDQVNSIIPALERMEIFKDTKFEVLNSPFVSEFEPSKTKTESVQLTNNFIPSNKVKIYCVWFSPGVFKEQFQKTDHGVYMLPPSIGEFDFTMRRSILTNIDLDRLEESKFKSEAIIEPTGKMVNEFLDNPAYIKEAKRVIIESFKLKLDHIFSMTSNEFTDANVSDVQRFGTVHMRVSSDSYTIDPGYFFPEQNNYFRVTESMADLPF